MTKGRILKNILKKAGVIVKNLFRFFFRPQITMSNARLNMYSTCPLKYKYSYEKGLKGFPSCYLHFGSVIHSALKNFHSKFDMKGEQGTLDDLIKEYEKLWDELKEDMIMSVSGPPTNRWRVALAEAKSSESEIKRTLKRLNTIYISSEEEEEFKKRGVEMLENYFKDNQTNPNKIIAVEKALTLTIKGLDILGYIDRIERTPEREIEVVDYKSGKRTKTEEAILLGGDPQAIIYTMLVEKKWKRKLKNFYFHYLSNRTKVPCNIPKRLIDDTFDKLALTAKNIKYQKFEPSPGPLCGWCDYEVICPSWGGKMAPFRGIFRATRERGRMTFSYSKMSMYKNCPYNYKKLYIDKETPKPKNFFAIGHSCHETMEEFFSYPYQSSVRKMRKMYERNWHSEGYKDAAEEQRYFEDGWRWLENYYKKYIDGQYIQAEALELYFQLPIGNDYVVIGYMDRLQKNPDGTYEIFDYKTDPKLRAPEELKDDLQLTAYYWAMKQLGIEVDRLSLEFLQFNQRVSTKRTPEDIPPFVAECNKVVGEMAKREEELKREPEKADELFPPMINKYCGGCDHLIGCPKEKEIRTVYKDKIMNLQDKPISEPEESDEEEDK